MICSTWAKISGMKPSGLTARWIAVLALTLSLPAFADNNQPRERALMDFGWRFKLGDPADAGAQFAYPEVKDLAKTRLDEIGVEPKGADPVAQNLGHTVSWVQPGFNDKSWRKLDLPHDWAVELPADPKGNLSHGFKDLSETAGTAVGWYRRTFELHDTGKSLWLEFDGVFRNCLVWLNGHCLGRNVSGYNSFNYDIGKYANLNGNNVLVVRVDASRTEGWFYEGAGIYRHVWLVKAPAVHIAP